MTATRVSGCGPITRQRVTETRGGAFALAYDRHGRSLRARIAIELMILAVRVHSGVVANIVGNVALETGWQRPGGCSVQRPASAKLAGLR